MVSHHSTCFLEFTSINKYAVAYTIKSRELVDPAVFPDALSTEELLYRVIQHHGDIFAQPSKQLRQPSLNFFFFFFFFIRIVALFNANSDLRANRKKKLGSNMSPYGKRKTKQNSIPRNESVRNRTLVHQC
jgi:hypothetical protein